VDVAARSLALLTHHRFTPRPILAHLLLQYVTQAPIFRVLQHDPDHLLAPDRPQKHYYVGVAKLVQQNDFIPEGPHVLLVNIGNRLDCDEHPVVLALVNVPKRPTANIALDDCNVLLLDLELLEGGDARD